MKIKPWNFYTFTIEAEDENIAEMMWLGQFFQHLPEYLIPIFSELIEVKYEESYQKPPTIEDFLTHIKKGETIAIRSINFHGDQQMSFPHNFKTIQESYQIAKDKFMKIAKEKEMFERKGEKIRYIWDENDEKEYQEVLKYFTNH